MDRIWLHLIYCSLLAFREIKTPKRGYYNHSFLMGFGNPIVTASYDHFGRMGIFLRLYPWEQAC